MRFQLRTRFLLSLLLLGVMLLFPDQQSTVSAQPASPGIWEGIYTTVQVSRGQTIYQAECASCHREDLTGQDMSPSLVGVGFAFKWQGRSVQELYASMRYGMPQTAPGSLSDRAYADLTAFLLSRNGFPPGEGELGADEDRLALIEITSKR